MRTCLVNRRHKRVSQAQYLTILGIPHHGLVMTELADVLPLPADATEVPETHHITAEIRALLHSTD